MGVAFAISSMAGFLKSGKTQEAVAEIRKADTTKPSPKYPTPIEPNNLNLWTGQVLNLKTLLIL
jgi:hypothetical protein